MAIAETQVYMPPAPRPRLRLLEDERWLAFVLLVPTAGAARPVHRLSVRARHPAVGDQLARRRARRVRRPRQLLQDLQRRNLPHLRLQHLRLYGRHHRLQAGARAVAGHAAQPQFPRQGLHPRLHPAALHHPDRALDLRLEVDVRPDIQRPQLAALPSRPDHRPDQLAGRSGPRDDLDHRRQHLARGAVLRHQPARRPADHQPRTATRPPPSTAPSRGSGSGTSPGRCCCR